MEGDDDSKDKNFVTALARGLAVIRAFETARRPLRMSDVADATGLPKATIRRSLLTLRELGYVALDGRFFRLTPRVLTLGYAYLASTALPHAVLPFLEQLSEELQASSSAAILDQGDIVYIARAATRRTISFGLSVGSRLPAYCTALGRALLSALDEGGLNEALCSQKLRAFTPYTNTDAAKLRTAVAGVRANGFAIVDQELEIGLRAVAVPVKNAAGDVVAAINLSISASRLSLDSVQDRFVPALQSAAERVRPMLLT